MTNIQCPTCQRQPCVLLPACGANSGSIYPPQHRAIPYFKPRVLLIDLTCLYQSSQPCMVDGRCDYPTTMPNQPLQGERNFGDSPWTLFSIYSDAAKNEDSEMVVR